MIGVYALSPILDRPDSETLERSATPLSDRSELADYTGEMFTSADGRVYWINREGLWLIEGTQATLVKPIESDSSPDFGTHD